MNLDIGNTQKIIADWRGDDLRQLAYALATTHHETGGTMLPVREKGGKNPAAYFFKMYDPDSPDVGRAELARRMGALAGDGVVFYGRGYAQITWRPNYVKFEKLLKQDFTSSALAADRVLEHTNAFEVLYIGMTKGLFTGKKLSDYINAKRCDYLNARRIINGRDCAQMVADKAAAYFGALQARATG